MVAVVAMTIGLEQLLSVLKGVPKNVSGQNALFIATTLIHYNYDLSYTLTFVAIANKNKPSNY